MCAAEVSHVSSKQLLFLLAAELIAFFLLFSLVMSELLSKIDVN